MSGHNSNLLQLLNPPEVRSAITAGLVDGQKGSWANLLHTVLLSRGYDAHLTDTNVVYITGDVVNPRFTNPYRLGDIVVPSVVFGFFEDKYDIFFAYQTRQEIHEAILKITQPDVVKLICAEVPEFQMGRYGHLRASDPGVSYTRTDTLLLDSRNVRDTPAEEMYGLVWRTLHPMRAAIKDLARRIPYLGNRI